MALWSIFEISRLLPTYSSSGTTAKMAILNNRHYIGSEISAEYCEIIRERLEGVQPLIIPDQV